ncbi:hypothetical protein WG922_16775 [Ramlibacter sp. AN1015]|uniref:hypothetical protein n=1 Tax=Ramlibacter sp. AN1015 TaxID=3133428 RepID=UPI0030BB4DA3
MDTINWRRQAVVSAVLWAAASVTSAAATKPGDYYVSLEQVPERLAPSESGKSTNTLYKRQKVSVEEVKGGWARVSRYYDGRVEGLSGQVARWVPASSLSPTRPPDDNVAGGGTPLGQALKDSDQFGKHSATFLKASQALIDSGRCKLQDFKDNGGWSKSTQKGAGVYFTYCGGMHRNNRWYLDVSTGRTFQ